MDIHDLKIFRTVAVEQSISKAAQKLNYVQSNVTMRIKQLEKELQTPLFYRHGRGVQMTSAGKTLLAYTEKILQLLDETYKAVQYESAVMNGSLTLGSTESTAAVRLPSLLTAYCQAYPQVECTLETHSSSELVQRVIDYKLDAAFVPGPIHHPDLVDFPVWQEELVLVNNQQEADLHQLVRQKPLLVFGTGCAYRARMEKWFNEEGIIPRPFREFSSIDTILGCVQAGLGIGIMTKSMLDKYLASSPDVSLFAHALPQHYASVTIGLIYRQDVFMSKALEKFIEMLQKDHLEKTPSFNPS
ncbi:LysR family transcriptional regulator [Thermoflavimicrobium dichotomicum]|uniref:DNA-binding transcriptional regulator, LysR family n=1 Tax=Thermoflavimicrobium dichotomicum TaxID=46223 RepID=A0A1I3T3Q3_9BACL|nr:LysR family transcriptional regulator [Thermoflavimicrobium dichotomicum]SFJ64306.1 DNA-binding transcriptional regulator, LysR family [Thermoflavimicrobium dichotomicum]